MFERYTEQARRVIFFARYEVSALGGSSIDTEHILLGLLREGRGVTGKILERSQVTQAAVRAELEARPGRHETVSTSVDLPLSPEAKRSLQHASDEADRMSATHIGTEHLLLGLLRESESMAAGILTSRGLRLEEVREEVRLMSQGREAPPRPREAFHKFVDFLGSLEDRNIAFHITAFRKEAIRVEVAIPEERWVAIFFADGRVAVEVYSASGTVEDESALERLLDRLGPTPGAER